MEDLFSQQAESVVKEKGLLIAEVFDSAHIFGLLTEKPSDDRDKAEKKLIKSFYNNLTLLVQKTWVEKSDEALKEQVLFQLDDVSAALEEKKICNCLRKIYAFAL